MIWRCSAVSPCGTHHIRNGDALYSERFDEVLKFRDPGLAAVRRDGKAWHIRSDGTAAYRRRFERTFGFYEGLAAAVGPDGWKHIRSDGTDLQEAGFAWCGNFQEGRCVAREFGGAYVHLTPEGVPAYVSRWRYAGDYRDGIAVVQFDDGRSTHVDRRGDPVHGVRFIDLDVFHKGFARARDDDGWTHIDAVGRSLYVRRFASVEPFYNGQARVERFDGGLEVIDEAGEQLIELRSASKSEFATSSDDLTGFWRTQTICAAVELGVFEALPATATELARTCGLDPQRARRLLRALAELRLVTGGGGIWHVTGRGACLTTRHQWTLADAAVEYGRSFSKTWECLPEALRLRSDWRAADVFADVASDPARVQTHHRMLMSYALHDYRGVPDVLDLRGDEHVIDAGGGLGALAGLLVEAHPGLRVTVLDRPELTERTRHERRRESIAFKAADLFRPWGVTGDAVILARVLHDWDDAAALRILRCARRALSHGGRLFVVEMVLQEDGSAGGLCDLHLLMVNGGKERTLPEYSALLARAGFVLDGVRELPTLPSTIVGVAQ